MDTAFDQLSIENNNVPSGSTSELAKFRIVYFDTETGGFGPTYDVLQIAMKCNDTKFNMYIKPTQYINPRATEVNGLTNVNGELYHIYLKKELTSYPLKEVLKELLGYLQGLGAPCILVAHNCRFDESNLIRIIEEVSLMDEFKKVVAGFVDSLNMFKKRFPERKGKGQLKLTTLAAETLQLSTEGAHDAMMDVEILEKLVVHHFQQVQLLQNMASYDYTVQLYNRRKITRMNLKTLDPLKIINISDGMRTKLASADITYDLLLAAYKKSEEAAVQLLEQREDGKPKMITRKKMLNSIIKYLKRVTQENDQENIPSLQNYNEMEWLI